MSHTYVSELMHRVFSAKGRRGLIPGDRQERLWAFMGGIARKNGFRSLAVGGTDNHVHVLLSLPATMPIAKALQLLKGGSSKCRLAGRLRCVLGRHFAAHEHNFLYQRAGGTSSQIGI